LFSHYAHPCFLNPVHTSNNVEATFSNATSQTILRQSRNKLTICIDFVERTKFYDKLVRHCCRFWQQSRMLLRYCCWCGRGFTLRRFVWPFSAGREMSRPTGQSAVMPCGWEWWLIPFVDKRVGGR